MYGVHTCDLRSSKSTLSRLYPSQQYEFEASFSEEDPLWEADSRETSEHVVERALTILDFVFRSTDTCNL